MTYNEYKIGALRTATYPKQLRFLYLRLGIREETGEVCGKLKKLIRDKGWVPGMPVMGEDRTAILLELGDVAWYCACFAHERGTKIAVKEDLDMLKRNIGNQEGTENICMKADDLANVATGENFIVAFIYIEMMAQMLGSSLNEVCQMNLDKLESRQKRNKIHGSGDYR